MTLCFQVLCAFTAGITVVAARSINAYLAKHVGASQSSFFNYLTGLITSFILLLILSFPTLQSLSKLTQLPNYWMLLGGVIGVVNIMILNIVVNKVAPIQLTLVIFIAQLGSGMLLDLFLYQIFSFQKLVGCIIVLLGLLHYQYAMKTSVLQKKGE